MKIYSTTLMVDKKPNCNKADAELLLLGAKPQNLDEYPNLKWIFRAGVGCDNVPIAQIEDRNIELYFPSLATRNIISKAVARLAFGWIIYEGTITRRIEDWYREPRKSEKKIYIVGYGHVGSKVGEMLGSVGIDFVPSDPKYEEHTYESADIITVHIPLITYEHGSVYRDNRNYINDKFLGKLRSDVVIINTSRGGIANEAQIADFLLKNSRAKYIADVFQSEPYTKECPLNPYLGKQFFGTPHIGSYTVEVRRALNSDLEEIINKL